MNRTKSCYDEKLPEIVPKYDKMYILSTEGPPCSLVFPAPTFCKPTFDRHD
jgi:hypothetical protein